MKPTVAGANDAEGRLNLRSSLNVFFEPPKSHKNRLQMLNDARHSRSYDFRPPLLQPPSIQPVGEDANRLAFYPTKRHRWEDYFASFKNYENCLSRYEASATASHQAPKANTKS